MHYDNIKRPMLYCLKAVKDLSVYEKWKCDATEIIYAAFAFRDSSSWGQRDCEMKPYEKIMSVSLCTFIATYKVYNDAKHLSLVECITFNLMSLTKFYWQRMMIYNNNHDN